MNNKTIASELQYEVREYLLYYWKEESNKDSEKEKIKPNKNRMELSQIIRVKEPNKKEWEIPLCLNILE